MDQEICSPRLFKRGLETRDQMMGKIANETDGVAEQHPSASGHTPSARARVKRGKEFVFDKFVRSRKEVEQCALPSIGVPD